MCAWCGDIFFFLHTHRSRAEIRRRELTSSVVVIPATEEKVQFSWGLNSNFAENVIEEEACRKRLGKCEPWKSGSSSGARVSART